MIKPIKKSLIDTFNKLLAHQDVQPNLYEKINQSKVQVSALDNYAAPYELGSQKSSFIEEQANRSDIVFVTSRFRSGSTVLWNAFRNLGDSTAYYEPFNERKWFNKNTRGDRVDNTHVGVNDYWHEFDGMDDLDAIYQESWIREKLLMDKNSWDPSMKRYICELISRAKGRPVLQFNRIDFRLQWLKHHFPNAKIVHLYRHPRDQWCSFLTDKQKMNKDDVEISYIDGFYLNTWCRDLSKHFPFLASDETPHPYARFYLLWKLSFLYGQKFSDYSLGYEKFSAAPEQVLTELVTVLGWSKPTVDKASSVVKPPVLNKWKNYAEEQWFSDIECHCESVLSDFLRER